MFSFESVVSTTPDSGDVLSPAELECRLAVDAVLFVGVAFSCLIFLFPFLDKVDPEFDGTLSFLAFDTGSCDLSQSNVHVFFVFVQYEHGPGSASVLLSIFMSQ
jgi:hypothetical protein